MAYVSTEKAAKIKAGVKAATPKGWRVTVRIAHHSSAIATIRQAPRGVLADLNPDRFPADRDRKHFDVSARRHEYRPDFLGKTGKIMTALQEALDVENFDHSDRQTDYFHVGHYTTLKFGDWDCEVKLI